MLKLIRSAIVGASLFALPALYAEAPPLQPTLAGAGLFAGVIELSFAPVWSDYIRKAKSTDRIQSLLQLQAIGSDVPAALTTQVFRNESQQDLKLGRSLRSQAYGGAGLLLGASALLALGPEFNSLSDWSHPAVPAVGLIALGLGASFTGKFFSHQKELSDLKNRRDAVSLLLLMGNRNLALVSYHVRLEERIYLSQKRRNESAFISLEYVSLAAIAFYGFFAGRSQEPTQSTFSPILFTRAQGTGVGVLYRF